MHILLSEYNLGRIVLSSQALSTDHVFYRVNDLIHGLWLNLQFSGIRLDIALGLINLGGIRGFICSFVTVLADLGHLTCEEWRLAGTVDKLNAA